ncbi:MAG: cytochrome c [Verrucomicrobiota bacterium]|jgi:mono/diheme cytochrome c family protein
MRYFYLIFLLLVVTVIGMAGFRGGKSRQPPIELFNDMVRQNKVRPQSPSDFFDDQRGSRVFPDGAVARSDPYEINGKVVMISGNPVYPYQDVPMNTGRVPGATNFVDTNPLEITRQLLDRGQERYQIYCMPCHGPAGDGKGVIGKYGMGGMANFHDQRLVNMGDGEIFHTMSAGKNLMPAYGAIVPVPDRWAIISYIRALQRSQLATVDDVPESKRADLKK